jgi:hypothetical protein
MRKLLESSNVRNLLANLSGDPANACDAVHLQARAQQEVQSKVEVVAGRAAKAVNNCAKEKAWPSKVEPFAHGTFSLPPEQLKAIRRAYQRPHPLQPEHSDDGSI